jgi:hypothetical protein
MRRNNLSEIFNIEKPWVYFYLIVTLTPVVAWLTHVVECLITAKYGLLIAGVIFPPVGVIHGVSVWFGGWS